MDGVMGPRESGRFISEMCTDISINGEAVDKLAKLLIEKLKSGEFSIKMWRRHPLNPQTMDDKAVDWVFVSAVLNFSFWSDREKFSVSYKGEQHTGYWTLCACLNRALDEGIAITTPSYYATVDLKTLQHVFRSDNDTEIPLIEDRLRVLNEAGKVLMEKHGGSFANVLKKAEKSAQSLLKLVLKDFTSFQDIAEYKGRKVGIYKRAQILVGDVWGCCEGQGLGEFHDIDTITMFADYRIPQALVYFNVMKYSDNLMEKLQKAPLLVSGEKMEVEIRGVSLWACELVRDKMVEILTLSKVNNSTASEYTNNQTSSSPDCNAVLVDHYLWDLRRELAEQMSDIPFHRCRGIFY